MTIKYLNKNYEIESINIDFVNDAITTYSIELPTNHYVVQLTTDENYCWCVLKDVAEGIIGYYPLPIEGWEDKVYEFELWLHNQMNFLFEKLSSKLNSMNVHKILVDKICGNRDNVVIDIYNETLSSKYTAEFNNTEKVIKLFDEDTEICEPIDISGILLDSDYLTIVIENRIKEYEFALFYEDAF